MFESLKARIRHGFPFIRDIKHAPIHNKFKGFPVIKKDADPGSLCPDVCPAGAITADPLEVDLGKCIFCGDCERECINESIKFTPFYKLAASERETLVVKGGFSPEEFEKIAVKKMRGIFGRSLKLRQVSAGGCNGCEMELSACSNTNFDMGRFGIEFTASPRHADGIVITGPVTVNMRDALVDAYNAVPEPKLIISAGACAVSGGIFQNSSAVSRSFFDQYKVSLYVPGCPVHPLTFINGLLKLLGQS